MYQARKSVDFILLHSVITCNKFAAFLEYTVLYALAKKQTYLVHLCNTWHFPMFYPIKNAACTVQYRLIPPEIQ